MTKSNAMREIDRQNENEVGCAVLSDSNVQTRVRVNGGIGHELLLRSRDNANAVDLLTRLEKENFELRQTVVDLALDLQLLRRNGGKKAPR
jgi:hypothetical protein